MKKVFVIGTVVADIIARCKTLPKPGETVVGHSSLGIRLGGKGLNQALHLKDGFNKRSVNSIVTLCASVGDDVFGKNCKRLLRERGIEALLRTSPRLPTGTGTIHMDENGQNAIVVSPGANFEDPIDNVALTRLKQSDAVVCQWELSPDTTLKAFKNSSGKRILSAAPVPQILSQVHEETLALSHVVVVNTVEAESLGLLRLDGTLSDFKSICKNTEALVVTRGAEGVSIYDRSGQIVTFPGTDDVAVDAVGAGDCFVGHFVAELLGNGASYQNSAKQANIAAGAYVSQTKEELTFSELFAA